ncbi:oligomycin resistance ATP-dependent permease yor1 [Penicillium herquei]|nr:oligomycin resistance ATP-dependent permease yor1 [Penicillium herquei]
MSKLESGQNQVVKSRGWLGTSTPAVPEERKTSPEYKSSWVGKLTFSWMGDVMWAGYKRKLEPTDIPLINPSRGVQDHNSEFSTYFAEYVADENCKSPLLKAIHKTFFREFWLAGFFRIASDLLTVASRYSIRYLITYLTDAYIAHIPGSGYNNPQLSLGVGLAVGLILMNVLMSWTQQHFLYTGQAVGAQVRAVLTAKIQEKSMKISERAKVGITVTMVEASSSEDLDNVDLSDANQALRQLNGEDRNGNLTVPAPPFVTGADSEPASPRYSRYSRYPRNSQYPQSPQSPRSPGFGGYPDEDVPPVPAIPKAHARQSRVARISRYSYFFGNQTEQQYPDTELPVTQPRSQRARNNSLYPGNSTYQRSTLYPRDSQYPRNSLYPRSSLYPPKLPHPRQSRYTWYARASQWFGEQEGQSEEQAHLHVPQPKAPRLSRYTRDLRYSQFPDNPMPDVDRDSAFQDGESEFFEPEIEYENEKGELVEVHGQGWSNARITNLINIEANRIDNCIAMIHMAWTAPIIIVLCMTLILVNISYSGLSGLGCIIFSFYFLGLAVKKQWVRRHGVNQLNEARVSLTQEVISTIRMVKFFGWEPSFLDRLTRISEEQSSEATVLAMIFNFTMALGQSLPNVAAMASFITYGTGSGNALDIAIVFSSTALFQSLLLPSTYLPAVLGQVSQSGAGLKKIQEFLLAEEKEEVEIDRDMKDAIKIENAEFSWDKSQAAPAEDEKDADKEKKDDLKSDGSSDVTLSPDEDAVDPNAPFILPSFSLKIRRGELLAVIGGIGAGKSSLLSALMGDMRKSGGRLRLSSEVAYCPQAAWIQSATVRENILFGSPYDPYWYETVVNACQLRRDFEIFANGDATQIDEKGSNMSGGQKQRVSLARAVYSKKEIVLLDDVLSAVDPHVGIAIFDQAILGLLRHKTVIFSTHTAHILDRCDRILWLDHGAVKALGTFNQVKSQHSAFGDMVSQSQGEDSEESKTEDKESDLSKDAKNIMTGFSESKNSTQITIQDNESPTEAGSPVVVPSDAKSAGVSMLTVCKAYLASTKSWIPVILAFPLLCIALAGVMLCGIWLSAWAEDTYNLSRNVYIGIYVAIGMSMAISIYLYGICVASACHSANLAMLKNAHVRVVNAPTWFFDVTPLGQVVSRFAKDYNVMEDALPEALRLFFYSVGTILAICILIIYHFPWFALAVGPCCLIFFIAVLYYRGSASQLKVYEGNFRGAVAGRFTETLSGIPTIRAYSQQSAFALKMQNSVDDMVSASLLSFGSQRWLAFRLDFLGILLIVVAVMLVMIDKYTQNPGVSAVVLTYSLAAVQSLQYIIRQWAQVEVSLSSVERMYIYSFEKTFPAEGTNNKTIEAAPRSWPEQGAITFSNVRMRYRSGLPEVLCGLNLTVRPGEHIGIVGRTGAGKSSLISALFRVCELARGTVSIDGVDISKLALSELRPRISIQPQESLLFAGTVRDNIDPLGEHTDQELWLALRGAWLADSMQLDDPVEEEGSNFSHGQRQQIGLARLLVKDSKIVICDEATSSVDAETDQKIQQTMVKAFKGKTLLTVAHRIRTIIHYDRICVMDHGRIAEVGTPYELYRRGGVFREMCITSGITEREILSHHS